MREVTSYLHLQLQIEETNIGPTKLLSHLFVRRIYHVRTIDIRGWVTVSNTENHLLDNLHIKMKLSETIPPTNHK